MTGANDGRISKMSFGNYVPPEEGENYTGYGVLLNIDYGGKNKLLVYVEIFDFAHTNIRNFKKSFMFANTPFLNEVGLMWSSYQLMVSASREKEKGFDVDKVRRDLLFKMYPDTSKATMAFGNIHQIPKCVRDGVADTQRECGSRHSTCQ